jgi:hypothetical protein
MGAFGPAQTAGLNHNPGYDMRVVWYDDSDHTLVTRPLVYMARVSVDTLAQPPSLRVDYFKNGDLATPRFSLTLKLGLNMR